MAEHDSQHPIRTAQERLVARRRAERFVVERLLTAPGGARSAGAVVRTVMTCSRELSDAGVEHGLPEVLHSMARTRLALVARMA
jgi:hypothetical protein